MKALLLVAGALGVLAFFALPFFVFELPGTRVEVSAYHLLVGFDDPSLDPLTKENGAGCVKEVFSPEMIGTSCSHEKPHDSYVPLYFLSSVAFVLLGLVAVIRRRFSGLLALFTLAGSFLALGGWTRELKLDRANELSHTAAGATLLGISGLLALVASLAVLIKREPDPKPRKKKVVSSLPEARVVR